MKVKALLLIVAFAVVTAVAQRGMGPGGMGQGPGFKYDPSAETKLTGTIEEIKTMGACATHLVVKTDAGNTDVALGPTKFLKDQGLELNKGDQVEVTGVKTTMRRGDIFITRQITIAGKTINLRDEKGLPAWPRGTCK
jgi:hypothetical protein